MMEFMEKFLMGDSVYSIMVDSVDGIMVNSVDSSIGIVLLVA